MGSVCQSLFRFCCEAQEDDEDRQRVMHHPGGVFTETTMPFRMTHRGTSSSSSSAPAGGAYQHPEGQGLVVMAAAAAAAPPPPEEEDSVASGRTANDSSNCCQPEPHSQGIHDFLRRLFIDRWRPSDQPYDIMRQGSEDDDLPPTKKLIPPSPLRQAVSYDSSRGIPCISSDEVVMPGSLLQKEMARQMMSAKLTDDDVECVICMEGFDPTNPRMPTLCGCGENKTYFHLPCLYQWLEQSRECPSCRTKLAWEEF